jgi:acetyl esterase/lipase
MMSLKLILTGALMIAAALAGGIYMYAGRPGSITVLGALFNTAVAERGVKVTTDVVYGEGARRKLDIYEPLVKAGQASAQTSGSEGPIAIFLYGGSWQQGDRGLYEFVGRALAKKGVTTVIPDYRLYPEVKFPAFMDDAADAYEFVARSMAMRPNGKNRPIVLIGHSAGAHMAALLTLDPAYLAKRGTDLPPPSVLIGLAGPYAFDPTTWPSTKAVFADVKDPDTARPIAFAKRGGPPTLLMHGLEDDTAKIYNMRDFAKALKAAGTTVQTLEFEKIGHISLVTSIAKPLRGWAPTLQAMREFMMRHANLAPEVTAVSSGSAQPAVLPPQ